MKISIISASALLAVTLQCAALEVGDVAVVGYNSSGTDAVAFVAWVEIPEGEEITVTDRRYERGGDGSGEGSGGGTYASKNSWLIWENDTGSPIAAGTVIVVSTDAASLGSASGNLQLTNAGEHIFLIQGTFNGNDHLIGSVLFGLDYDASSGSGWDGGSESDLPGAISGPFGNLFFDGDLSKEFTGSRSGKAIPAYREDVMNTGSWGSPAGSSLNDEAFVDGAQAVYAPGDLMILGWNANEPDSVSFVSWVDIPNGESFLLLDADYDGAGDGTGSGIEGGHYANLEMMTWTNNEGIDLPAGTVVVISDMADSSPQANVGSVSGGFDLDDEGEQLFIAYGSVLEDGGNNYFEGDLIFGLDFEGGPTWGEPGESSLPGNLNGMGGNLSFGSQMALEYSAARTGSPVANFSKLVLDSANWSAVSSNAGLDPQAFAETGVPPVEVPDKLGQVNGGLQFHARRMNHKLPILDESWSLAQGAGSSNSDNLNGACCVRLPSWLPSSQRVDPAAEYYLYFADHSGNYIRMAWAADLEGPWTGYRMDERLYSSIGNRGVLSLGADDEIDTGRGLTVDGHIASPQVFIEGDHVDNLRFVMYYHGRVNGSSGPQRTVAATSADGLNFNMPSGGDSRPGQSGHGTLPVNLGESYFRVFKQADRYYAFSNTGDIYQAPAGDPLAGSWDRGPQPFTDENESRGFVDWGDGYGPLRPRHFGVLTREGNTYAFYTNKAASPERILVSTFDFDELPADYQSWKGDFPSQELIRPEEDWEGGSLPLDISELGGETTPTHQLRDPGVLEDTDGRTYVFYSGSGEKAIGLAQIVSLPLVTGSTQLTTGENATFTILTDHDVSPAMLRISKAIPAEVRFGAEDDETQELVHAGNDLAHEQTSTVNDGVSSYRLAHDAREQSVTLTLPERYYARPGADFEFNSKMGVSTTGQFAELQISFDGSIWQTMWIQQGGTAEANFNKVKVNIDGLVGRVFELRFRYAHEALRNANYSSGIESGKGWFIDQVVATGLEAVTDISDSAFTAESFTLSDIAPVIGPHLRVGGDLEDRFLLSVDGLHSGPGFSELTGYGKPFVIRVRDSYEDFLDKYFTSAEQDDPLVVGKGVDFDGDGMTNLLEHGFASDPTKPDAGGVVFSSGSGGAPDPEIAFTWDPQAGYAYELQMSTSLDAGGFKSIPYVELRTPNGSLLDVVLKPDPSLYPLGPRAFFRLKVAGD
ncbi:hypothetical protein ACFQY0_11405 [Haloferula chungangensis]|uniref:Uncharacterized protein n=1 Tax=Haloferula chungangensis TaxID=1048331 RepID=A0ABW2L9B9_9BACT